MIKNYLLLYFAFFIYSFVSVFSKKAALQDNILGALFFVGIEIVFLFAYAIVWQQVLKRFPLVVAMSSKGVTVLLSLLWAVLFFGEEITLGNILGSIMIITGIWMVSLDA